MTYDPELKSGSILVLCAAKNWFCIGCPLDKFRKITTAIFVVEE